MNVTFLLLIEAIIEMACKLWNYWIGRFTYWVE